MRIAIDETHDQSLTSWIESANDPSTDFPIQNLPWCAFREVNDEEVAAGTVVGEMCVNLSELARQGVLDSAGLERSTIEVMSDGKLPLAAGRGEFRKLRHALVRLLGAKSATSDERSKVQQATCAQKDVAFVVPARIRDYTDFYASVHHATNVGSMFRPDNPLLPNYKWIPIGYHGRASSIVISGTDVKRPSGQLKSDDADAPVYAPCKLFDYELEVGFFVGVGNQLGETIPIRDAEEHIAGLCLVNDWSARDIQKWEYQPLGPFLAKSFATTVSPFIVTLDALAPFRCAAFERSGDDPKPLPHLFDQQNQQVGGIDLTLEVFLCSKQMRDRGVAPVQLSKGNFKHMYWTIAQMLAHHASNGCNLQAGDLMASGTVSGPESNSRGCLLELTWDGQGKPRKPIELPTGESRVFLADGDEVIMRAHCERSGYRRIGFGECRGVVRNS